MTKTTKVGWCVCSFFFLTNLWLIIDCIGERQKVKLARIERTKSEKQLAHTTKVEKRLLLFVPGEYPLNDEVIIRAKDTSTTNPTQYF